MWQMVHLMNHPSSPDYCIQYAKYNLLSKICTLNKNLYSNSMPCRPQSNNTGSTIPKIISKHSLACNESTFQQLHLCLLDAPHLPLSALNFNTLPTSWKSYPPQSPQLVLFQSGKKLLWEQLLQDICGELLLPENHPQKQLTQISSIHHTANYVRLDQTTLAIFSITAHLPEDSSPNWKNS